MADDSTVTEGKRGGRAAPFETDAWMADGVNTAMNAMQPPGLHATSDAALVNSGSLELGRAHHSVLIGGDSSEQML